MLFKFTKNPDLLRLHGAFVDEEEREKAVRYLKTLT